MSTRRYSALGVTSMLGELLGGEQVGELGVEARDVVAAVHHRRCTRGRCVSRTASRCSGAGSRGVGCGADDDLAVEREPQVEHAVHAGVLRAHVEDEALGVQQRVAGRTPSAKAKRAGAGRARRPRGPKCAVARRVSRPPRRRARCSRRSGPSRRTCAADGRRSRRAARCARGPGGREAHAEQVVDLALERVRAGPQVGRAMGSDSDVLGQRHPERDHRVVGAAGEARRSSRGRRSRPGCRRR